MIELKGKTYDWEAIKTEFVTGEMSITQIAKKYGVSTGTVYKHCRSENWNEAKDIYREGLEKGENEEISTSVTLTKEMDIADKLSDVLSEALSDEKQFYRYIVKEKNGADSTDEERIFGKMDMQALNNAIKALDSLQEIKRVMQGILNQPDAEEKVSSPEEIAECGVVILPEIKDGYENKKYFFSK